MMDDGMDESLFAMRSWIASLISGNPNLSLLDPLFHMEDGMSKDEYVLYELEQFASLSKKYDLDADFSIISMASFPISERKTSNFIKILNSIGKIVCKMSITVTLTESEALISGNDSFAQIVPKRILSHSSEGTSVVALATAIKPKGVLASILSKDMPLSSFGKGSNYENDGFFYASFDDCETESSVRTISISTLFDGTTQAESRSILFEACEDLRPPFLIDEGTLSVVDCEYPVHLSVFHPDGSHEDFEYPRGISVPFSVGDSAIITDCMDNDWNVSC